MISYLDRVSPEILTVSSVAAVHSLLHALGHAHRDRPHLLDWNADVDTLGVGVRNHALLADIDRHFFLLDDATGAANRDLNLLLDRLIGAALHHARLTDRNALADRDGDALGHFAGNPALHRLGLRARIAASRGARIAAVFLLFANAGQQAADTLADAGANRNFTALPVSLVHHPRSHFRDLLRNVASLHDRLFGPDRHALANRAGFHDRFFHIPFAANGPGARLGVGFATIARAGDLPLLHAVGRAANLTLLLDPFDAGHGARLAAVGACRRTAAVCRGRATVDHTATLRLPTQEVCLGAPDEGDRQQASHHKMSSMHWYVPLPL